MLSFATPWLLAGIAALPALYLLLRLTPPAARRARLPSLKLLGHRDEPPPPIGRPPWWLLALRLGAVALLLLGLAGPMWQAREGVAAPARLAMVIDNGWVAAADWPRVRGVALERLDALRMSGTRVAVMTTAAPPGGWPDGRPPAPRFTDVATARATVEALRPQPWASDRASIARLLPKDAQRLWIADGIEDEGAATLRAAMRGGDVAAVPSGAVAITLGGRTAGGWTLRLARAADAAEQGEIVARDARGTVLLRSPFDFAGADTTAARLTPGPAERNRIARIEVAGQRHPAAALLVDARAARPRVAIVEGARQGEAAPLESAGFYVRRALETHAEIARVEPDTLPRDPAQLMMLVDAPIPAGPLADRLLKRVRDGAVVVSFAGPRLAENGSALSPAPLRAGARALGGVLSWQTPQRIGGWAANGPLARLPIPPEATVARQILASADAPDAMRWAWLADGTPLVTARREGAGLLILVHTSAAPGWSNLPLSGLFEAMLTRLLPLALNPAATDIASDRPLTLDRMLDATGELVPAPLRARIAAADWDAASAGPRTPPGLYVSGAGARPLNLAPGPHFRFAPLSTSGLHSAGKADEPLDLGRWMLLAGLLLLLADGFVALALRGALPRVGIAIAAVIGLIAFPAPSRAQQAALQLAYIATGNPVRDRTSAEGLAALARVLSQRTAVAAGPPVAVDPARDALGRYPLLYWPAISARPLDAGAAARVRAYLDRGGMILFDLIGGNDGGRTARMVLGPLGLPPLEELGDKHVLSRSFYLLDRFPGARGNPAVWTEAGTRGDSGRVAGVVIGSADWAGAWRPDSPLPYATREAAWRFGVNLVMYALTGTYKADQVHARALLDRIGEEPRRPR